MLACRHDGHRRAGETAGGRDRSALGSFYDPSRGVLHATGFVVKPDQTIAVAQYSSPPIGRLVWQDIVELVQFYKKQAK
jgi:hypothetical protein